MANDSPGRLVGIDLGTTLSVISHLDSSGATVTLPNSEGEPLTRSAIYIDGNNVVVGNAAKEAAAHYPDKVATIIKRYMGQPSFPRNVDGRIFRPETLSAIILRKLKEDAERHIGPISKAVITVPAYFDDTRRKATEDAGRIAGLDVLDIVNEPTAAALAHALQEQLKKDGATFDLPGGELTALVYDLGGGTFDVTVVRLARNDFETVAIDGAVKLGGRDWDEKIVDLVCREFEAKHGAELAPTEQRREALTSLAESTKKLLSKLPSAPIECSYEDRALRLDLTRSKYEEITRGLLVQTEFLTKDVVTKQAQLDWDDIDRVLLVGGSTRMPMVKEMLRRVTGMEPDSSLDPDQVVAKGAAIFAGITASKTRETGLMLDEDLQAQLEGITVQDVTAHSLGVETMKHKQLRNAVLIPKNTQLPYATSRVFRTVMSNATQIRVKVLEGEAPNSADNMCIGECIVDDLPRNMPAKSPVQVRLSFEKNGRVSVMALEMTKGGFAHAEIRNQSGLTEEDIQREAAFVSSLDIQ